MVADTVDIVADEWDYDENTQYGMGDSSGASMGGFTARSSETMLENGRGDGDGGQRREGAGNLADWTEYQDRDTF